MDRGEFSVFFFSALFSNIVEMANKFTFPSLTEVPLCMHTHIPIHVHTHYLSYTLLFLLNITANV